MLIAEPLASYYGAVSLSDDAVSFAPCHNIRSCQPRMKLPLSDTNLATLSLTLLCLQLANIVLELVEVVDAVIRHSDRFDFAVLLGLD